MDIPDLEVDQSTIAEEKETLTKEEKDIVLFDNFSDHSLFPQRSCIKCSPLLVETNERLVKCSSSHSIQLASSCLTTLVLKLTKAGKTYTSDSTVLSRYIPSDAIIGQNEDFLLLYILSNKFIIKHINQEIVSIELAKDKSEKID